MMNIREIQAETTFAVRLPVLRAGKPIETCKFDGDDLATTVHFGYYANEKLVGVASIFRKSSELFSESLQFQLRGMAVLETHQKMGIGAHLFKHCHKYCKSQENGILWFNARTSAVPFYKSLNCQIIGEAFIIPEVGEHYVMLAD